MQVTQNDGIVSNAVITNKPSVQMRSADTAAFYSLLSSALYSNPKKAMIREVLCNAWDAHIDAGKSDINLVISCTDDTLIIRDFGKGIPKDDMYEIYGVYGSSTKTNSSNQTGGFGLGCKSPFAYTDTFNVTTFNGGFKTIFCMSKLGVVSEGRPTITEMVSVPTEETGLEVKIPVNGNSRDLLTLIKSVCIDGGIRATVNSVEIQGQLFIHPEDTWACTTTYSNSSDSVQVRYGNVLYPVNRSAYLYQLGEGEEKLLTEVQRSSFQLILIAKPDTLSITPSRESLYYSELTNETIIKLMKACLVDIHNGIQQHGFDLLTKNDLDYLERKDDVSFIGGNLFVNTLDFPTYTNKFYKNTDTDCISHSLLCRNTLLYKQKNSVVNHRKQQALTNPSLDKGLVASFLKCPCIAYSAYSSAPPSWIQQRVIKQVVKVATLAGIPHKKIYIREVGQSRGDKLVTVSKFRNTTYKHAASFCKKEVTLAYKKTDLDDGDLVCVIPRKAGELERISSIFENAGYTVIDETDEVIKQPRVAGVKRASVRKSYPTLTSVCRINGNHSLVKMGDTAYLAIDSPEFFVFCNSQEKQPAYIKDLRTFVQLHGDTGVVISTKKEQQALEKLGVPSHIDFIKNKIAKLIKSNPNINLHLAVKKISSTYSPLLGDFPKTALSLFAEAIKNQTLLDHFKLTKLINSVEEDSYVNRLLYSTDFNPVGSIEEAKTILKPFIPLLNFVDKLKRHSVIDGEVLLNKQAIYPELVQGILKLLLKEEN